jgi:hypothetical protein
MPVVSLDDQRVLHDRRATFRGRQPGVTAEPQRLTLRQIWTTLILYCLAFWGMVGYAIYDLFGR